MSAKASSSSTMKSGRKNLTLTTIFLDGTRVSQRHRCMPGQWYTEVGIAVLLRTRLAETEFFFPGRRFIAVRLRDGNFNLVEQNSEAKGKALPPRAQC